jgi:LysR family transcriptional regulator for bpeEF and oprC
MDRLEALKLFVRVVESGSFSKAASAQGVGQPAVSKQIAALEEHLGAQLLNRTTRGLSLTAAGQDYYESAVRLIEQFEEAEARIGRRQAAPSGLVRVASSALLGRRYLMPRLPAFFARYPEVSVEFDITERHVNLIEDGVDVALRIGILSDSSLMARRIGDAEALTVATPDYLARRGEPARAADLADHDCIAFMFQGGVRPWRFAGPAGPIVVEPKGPVRSNDAEHIRAAVLAGLGIGHNAGWLYDRELASGALRRVLTDYPPERFPIHAVTPGGRRTPSRVRVFIDFLAEVCAAEPSLRIR